MSDLLQIPLLPVLVTFLAFRVGQLIQAKLKSPLCNPILIAVILVLGFLSVTNMELSAYQSGISFISWLMPPPPSVWQCPCTSSIRC